MRVEVVIPTYNEAAGLAPLVDRLLGLPPPADRLRVLVVDDGSPDGTGEVADRLAAGRPERLHVLHRPAREGLGRAYVAGFARALAGGADVVCQMDADGSHDPGALPRFLAAVDGGADAVFGTRYRGGGSLDPDWAPHRKLLSLAANRLVVPALLRLPLSDPTGGYRAWRRAALERIDPARHVRASGYGFQVEMAFLATRAGLRWAEVPIRFRERTAGRSKMTLRVQLRAVAEILSIRLRHRGAESP